jgi:hypothetical protein
VTLTLILKAGRVPAQRRQPEWEFRSLASLAIVLDQEEEAVQLVPEEYEDLPVLSKNLKLLKKMKLLKKRISLKYLSC